MPRIGQLAMAAQSPRVVPLMDDRDDTNICREIGGFSGLAKAEYRKIHLDILQLYNASALPLACQQESFLRQHALPGR